MVIINKYHKMFINSYPIHDFCREQKIKFSYFNLDDLVESINKLSIEGKIDNKVLVKHLNKWMYQGRKKIVFRPLDNSITKEIKKYRNIKKLIDENFVRSTEIKDITELSSDVNGKNHLVDIKYCFDKENEENLSKIVFFYVKIVKHITINRDVRSESIIPLPIYVTIDFLNNEIYSRINAKTNIYDISGDSILNDIDIAISYLESVLTRLGLDRRMNETDADIIKKTIYETHRVITALPVEIYELVNSIDKETNSFIESVTEKLEIELNDMLLEEINGSIKDLFIKEIVRAYSSEEKSIFMQDKFAFSTSVIASGESLSKLKHSSPGHEPLHSLPEYHNVRPILEETGKIDKNTIYWLSVHNPKNFIRSKLFVNSAGYGIISFEMYTYEEDINNVFSKIRESKPTRFL